jgi:hypothetical protein
MHMHTYTHTTNVHTLINACTQPTVYFAPWREE